MEALPTIYRITQKPSLKVVYLRAKNSLEERKYGKVYRRKRGKDLIEIYLFNLGCLLPNGLRQIVPLVLCHNSV